MGNSPFWSRTPYRPRGIKTGVPLFFETWVCTCYIYYCFRRYKLTGSIIALAMLFFIYQLASYRKYGVYFFHRQHYRSKAAFNLLKVFHRLQKYKYFYCFCICVPVMFDRHLSACLFSFAIDSWLESNLKGEFSRTRSFDIIPKTPFLVPLPPCSRARLLSLPPHFFAYQVFFPWACL